MGYLDDVSYIYTIILHANLLCSFWISSSGKMASGDYNKVMYQLSFTQHDLLVDKLQNICREFLDTKTYSGFYITFFTSIPASFIFFVFMAVSIGLYIGLCFYVNAFHQDFKISMANLHNDNSFQVLKEAVRFHNEMIKYFADFSHFDSNKLFL